MLRSLTSPLVTRRRREGGARYASVRSLHVPFTFPTRSARGAGSRLRRVVRGTEVKSEARNERDESRPRLIPPLTPLVHLLRRLSRVATRRERNGRDVNRA